MTGCLGENVSSVSELLQIIIIKTKPQQLLEWWAWKSGRFSQIERQQKGGALIKSLLILSSSDIF